MGKPQSIETFREIGKNFKHSLEQKEPSCFNGIVRVQRYRVTVEEIEEPVEVIAERLQKLWDYSDNHHDWQPLKDAANKIGYVLVSQVGNKRNIKKKR